MTSKISLFLFIICFAIAPIHAQEKSPFDKVVKKDGSVIEGKILRVTDQNVEIDPKGTKPFLMIPRNEIDLILYPDNTVVKMEQVSSSNVPSSINEEQKIVRNNGEVIDGFSWVKSDIAYIKMMPPKYLFQAGGTYSGFYHMMERNNDSEVKWVMSSINMSYLDNGRKKEIELRADVIYKPILDIPFFPGTTYLNIKNLIIGFSLSSDVDSLHYGRTTIQEWTRVASKEIIVPVLSDAANNSIGASLKLDSFTYKGREFVPTITFSKCETKDGKYYDYGIRLDIQIKE